MFLLLGWLPRSALAHDPQSPSSEGEHESDGRGDWEAKQGHICRGLAGRAG
jgi:hypothetical protein